MAASKLAQIFDEMSKERDQPSHTKTTGNIRAVEGGYEQEIISTSSPRPRYGLGDQVETVTKRSVRTTSSPTRESASTFTLRRPAVSPAATTPPVARSPVSSAPPSAGQGVGERRPWIRGATAQRDEGRCFVATASVAWRRCFCRETRLVARGFPVGQDAVRASCRAAICVRAERRPLSIHDDDHDPRNVAPRS
jgi:hypothetical protein